jgi:signal transduction histidine kinase
MWRILFSNKRVFKRFNKMNKLNNLKIKIIIPVFFILILVFFASSLVIIDREYNVAKDSLISSAESYSSLSIVTLVNNYYLYYESGFYQFIGIVDDLMMLNENVYSLQIVDVNGKIVFDLNEMTEKTKYDEETNGERYLGENDLIKRASSSTTSKLIFENEQYVDIIQPYIDEWGRHDYSVRYLFSLSRLVEMRQEMISTAFISSGIFIIISFFLIFFLFNRFITMPIGDLIKGVRLMSKGKLGHTVKVKTKDELGELALAFNKMSQDLKKSQDRLKDYSVSLEKLLKQKDEFVNQLGHDLKTPLMPLTTLIPILEEKEKDSVKKEWFEVIHRNIDYMKNLVLKTLELAKLNSPKTTFSLYEINLKDEVNRILENKKPLFTNKDITVQNKISNNYKVKADILRLEELFTNLLENSVKYNKDQGRITIGAKRKKDYVQVSIKDTGIGLTKEQVDHLFDEFYKADESRHDFESIGLGMSISKRIVEKHGGRIWVESPGIGKGTTIFFTLPLGQAKDKILKSLSI